MGGGGGQSSQPTTSTVTNTNIPEYAKPYVENMLGATQQQLFNVAPEGQITGIKPYTPYSTDPTAYVAGFSPLQQQAFQGTAGLQVPAEYQAAAGMTGAAGAGSMGLGTQAAGAGQRYSQMATSPGDVQAYMSPYVQQALAPQLAEMQRQSDIVQQGLKGQAVASGAFGGTRQALQASEQERNKQALMSQAIGQGYQSAYDRALQSMQYGAGLGLQGLQTGLQGYGQGLQAAGQLAGIGGQGLQSQMGILGAQQQAGAQQQQQQQNIINQAIQNYATAQQYPQQQLAFMNAMLRGLPLQTATTQTYQAPPSPMSQLAGLGTAAYGAYKMFGKKGGLTQDFEKKYAGGGITDINRKVLLEPQKYSPQMLDLSMRDGVVNPVIGGLAKAENADLVQRMQNAQMAQATPVGIDQANINPEMFTAAGGGIVAFANEGLVPQVVSPDDIAREEQEMVAGTRLEYSPAVKAALTAPSRQKETAYKTREQESMVGRGREIGKEFAGLVPSRAKLTTAATPVGIAAPGEYADEGSRGTAKGIIAGGPGKSPRDFGIGLTTPPTSVAAGPKAPAEPTAPAAPAKTDALSGYSEYQKLLESAGVSKDPYAADRAAVKEMKEKVAKDKQDAAAMALMQAGFGMMGGKSQYAMQNIGEGAKEGLAGYGKSMQEIKADEKEYAKINRELTKAEDALKRGDVEKYLDHRDKAETRAIQLEGVKAQKMAATKPSSTAELIDALAMGSKDPKVRAAAAQQVLGVSKTGTLTLEDALKALKELPSSAKLTPEQLIQQAQQMVALSRGGGGSTVPADIQTLLNKYR